MRVSSSRLSVVKRICERADLSTFDPYDIWKTSLGFSVKNFYNRNRLLGLPAAAALALYDAYANDHARRFYHAQEYPIVRALAAQALLLVHGRSDEALLLPSVRRHL